MLRRVQAVRRRIKASVKQRKLLCVKLLFLMGTLRIFFFLHATVLLIQNSVVASGWFVVVLLRCPVFEKIKVSDHKLIEVPEGFINRDFHN